MARAARTLLLAALLLAALLLPALAAGRRGVLAREAWGEPRPAWDLSRVFSGPAEPPGGWAAPAAAAAAAADYQANQADGGGGGCAVADAGVPEVVVRAYLDSAARELLPGAPLARATRWALAPGSGRCAAAAAAGRRAYRLEVLACFLSDGDARGWCARLRALADASGGDPSRWRFRTLSAEPAGAVQESALVDGMAAGVLAG